MNRKLSILLLALLVGVLLIAFFRRTGEQDIVAIPRAPAPQADSKPVALALTPGEERKRVEAAPTPDTQQAVEAAKEPNLAHLIVHIVGKADGAPLSSVRVSLFALKPDGGGTSGSAQIKGTKGDADHSPITDARGLVEFDLAPGAAFMLWAHGEDGKSGSSDRTDIAAFARGERRELIVELRNGNDLHFFGQLLRQDDRSPIAGAHVEVTSSETLYSETRAAGSIEASKPTPLISAISDTDGRFELRMPSWQQLDVEVRAPGFSPAILSTTPDHDAPERAKQILLAKSAALHARIIDSHGVAVVDAEVRLWTEAYNVGIADHGEVYLPVAHMKEWMSPADVQGVCALEQLPSDAPFHVEILRGGKPVRKDLPSLSLRPGEVRMLDWTLGVGCTIEGRVADQSGAVVSGAGIWLERATFNGARVFERNHTGEVVVESRTDEEGRFIFKDVSPGKWWVGPAATRYYWDPPDPRAIAPFAQMIEIEEGSQQRNVDLQIQRGLYIKGRVLRSSGAPGAKIFINGAADVASWPLSGQSLDDGSFALGPLVPGRYRLTADGTFSGDSGSEPVESEAGQEGVVLQLQAGGTISGVVMDPRTGTGCQAELTFALRGNSADNWMGTNSGSDGSFKVEGLRPGTYDIAARGPGDGAALMRGVVVQAGGETGGQMLNLSPGARLRIRYAGHEGFLNYSFKCDGVIVSGDGVEAGHFSETVAPAGHIVLDAHWPPNSTDTKEMDITAGEEKEVVFGGK
jgi:protocatechuate 3,4-dioxygenase beta subunit